MPSLKKSPFTATLLVVITAIFAFEWLVSVAGRRPVFADVNEALLVTMGANVHDTLASREFWRLVAAMFLHGNVLHWAANSWALYQLGTLYEAMFGSRRFIVFYFVTGICASIVSSLRIPEGGVSVGASGAIFGILGAFIFSIRRSPQWRNEPWTKSLIMQLLFWAAVNLVLGATVPVIDNAAHITGLVTGLLLGFIPHRVPPPPPSTRVIDVLPYEG